jgi:RNA polymerase sigma-70 factor (ECF subfamily)
LSQPRDFEATLAAARAGDADAISLLYRDLQPRLLRVLRVEVGGAAEDVASQTWLEVVGALARFEGNEAGFRAFVFTVARRRVSDHRRTRRRRPAHPTDPAAFTDAVDPSGDVESDVLAGLDADRAVRLLADVLTPDQAEVVLLRVVADLPVDEVARMLGRSPGTIRVQQHRALKRLAAALGGNDPPDPGDQEET